MTLAILVLEDETEVRNGLMRDLEPFMKAVRIEPAEDVDDAWEVIDELDDDDDELALILADHRLPGKSGVDFLVDISEDDAYCPQTCLVTGQADLEDTIRALNVAGLDHYIAKPWKQEELQETVRRLLTQYVLEQKLNPLPYMQVLDAEKVLPYLRHEID